MMISFLRGRFREWTLAARAGRQATRRLGRGPFVVLLLACLIVWGGGAAAVQAQDASDSTYTVQSGDTLFRIAQEVGVSVRTLMQWNDLDNADIQEGQTLRIRPSGQTETEEPASAEEPAPSDEDDPSAEPTPEAPETQDETDVPAAPDSSRARPPFGRHTVETGETFVTLALRLGTTADSLFARNDSTTAPIEAGRTLRLPRRFAPPTHVVESGETLYSIAGEYGVSVRALRAENDLAPDSLTPGQRLQIPGRTDAAVPPPGTWADPDSTGRVARYPSAFEGRLTASGQTYDPNEFVASHPSLPFGSVVLLSTDDPSRHTFARVFDRGPAEEGVLLDVSAAVAQALGIDADASPPVELRVVWVDRASN